MERLGSELGTHFIVVSERVRLVTPSRSRDELCGVKGSIGSSVSKTEVMLPAAR